MLRKNRAVHLLRLLSSRREQGKLHMSPLFCLRYEHLRFSYCYLMQPKWGSRISWAWSIQCNNTWLEQVTLRYMKRLQALCTTHMYTGCPRRNVPDFRRVFLMLQYTDTTQNTYIQSWTVTEIMAREKCGLLAVPRTAPVQMTRYVYTAHVLETGMQSTSCLRAHVKCLET